MDALVTAEASEGGKRKRSWAERQRRKISYLAGDVAALERLVGTLLGHLERAIQPDCTDQERNHYRSMITEIRETLAEGEAEWKAVNA